MAKRTKPRRVGGVLVFYSRDSSGRTEQSPAEYVEHALRIAQKDGLRFNGSPQVIDKMISAGQSVSGDIYFDREVQGHIMTRPALDALLRRIEDDLTVGDLFIPRRDRLSRPDNPLEAMEFEIAIRRRGVRIHFQDKVVEPLQVGERADLCSLITGLFDYEASGQFRGELAAKTLPALTSLIKKGFSAGGRAPFFLSRWLIDPQGNPVRQLVDGETVRMAGHHVSWLPGPAEKMALAIEIVGMLERMPASQVAAELNKRGVPAPDAGRKRTDNGVTHEVRGIWHQNTITNVVRSMTLMGVICYGRRGMGDQRRLGPEGVRLLTDTDLGDDGKPKIVLNPKDQWVIGRAKFDPPIEPERLLRLIEELDRRGMSQQGKARSRDPARNPLGARVFDMNCGALMYRDSCQRKGIKSFLYSCSTYSTSKGQECSHNQIDGPTASNFCLSVLRQNLASPTLLERVRSRLETLAGEENENDGHEVEIREKKAQLRAAQTELERIETNYARAESEVGFRALGRQLGLQTEKVQRLERELSELQSFEDKASPDVEIEAALGFVKRLQEYSTAGSDFTDARNLFELTNLRLFVGFRPVAWGKRGVNKPTGGIITWGNSDPPVRIYERKRGRNATEVALGQEVCPPHVGEGIVPSEGEEISLGNVSRGEEI